ncbi:MAG: ComEC/Rec2 family competence protein [Thermodesulfobacteriota bacterium]
MFFPRSDNSQGNLNHEPPESCQPGPATAVRPVARPLVPVTLALMTGIVAPVWGLSLPQPYLLAGVLVLWVALAFLWWRRLPARLLPLFFFGLLGVAFYQQARQPYFPPENVINLPQEQELSLMGHLNRPGKLGEDRVQLFMAAEAWRSPWGWRPVSGNLLVVASGVERPPVGTGLVVRGRLRTPGMLHNPGTFDRPRYLAADGLFLEVRPKDPQHLTFLTSTAAYPLGEKLRGGIREQLRALDPACRAIFLAMLLGDQGEITPEMRRNFARTGTSHLLVINGLHLGMVAAVTYFLCFWALRRFPWLLLRINVVKVATLVAAIPVVFYAWVAGGSPSTQRAEVMVLAYLLLVFLGRPKEVWSALALAALIILTLWPLRLFAISFQLSFVAVAALIYLVPRLVKTDKERGPDHHAGAFASLLFRGKEWLAVSVVAGLATAPLVAAYFHVVSLLGILVNLVAIPLVLLLALPLGEAAVIAQAFSLTPVAQGLLLAGKLPLWLGYQTIQWGARVPGSAIFMPTPTWLEIALYYLILILVFAPRRSYLTWAGAGLSVLVMVTAAFLPLATVPQALEVTCLDAYGGFRGVVVSPENRRLVVSAAAPTWPGQTSPKWGPLPGYCHWRQFRRLDLVMALNLSDANAGELLTLAEEFQAKSWWYGGRGREGPAYWDLWNYLGDRGQAPGNLMRGHPPPSLGSVDLKYLKLTSEEGLALEAGYQGRRVLLIPPARGLAGDDLPSMTGPLEALIIPAELGDPKNRNLILDRLNPRRIIIYGDPGRSGTARTTWPIPCQFTREGTVSVYLDSSGVTTRQWRP